MLLQIRDYIRQAGVVSSQQLTREFSIDEQALQPILDICLRKGLIRRCQPESASCQTRCFRCGQNPPVYYEFSGN